MTTPRPPGLGPDRLRWYMLRYMSPEKSPEVPALLGLQPPSGRLLTGLL